jgi:hypothetical protein
MPSQTSLRWPVCAAVSLAFFGANAGQGVAQDDGVHVDPKSPAGKEYALPLDQARRDAAGGDAPGRGSGDSAPLFGAGISKGSAGRSSGEAGTRPEDAQNGSPNSATEDPVVGGTDATQAARAVAADTGGGLSADVLTLLIALGVLVVGGLIGLSVRAVRGTDQSA